MSRTFPFIGRSDVLARMHERYTKATCGDGGAIVLRGEPGIGKSRLLDEFRSTIAKNDPHLVVTAALDYAPSPFAPIVTVIETWLEKRPALFDLHPGLRDAVETIVRADTTGAQPSAGERRRCFDSIGRLFRLAAADAPTTLVIDDLHWADPATLQLLFHIVVATRRSAFFLLATTRSAAYAGDDVRAELARLHRLENVAEIAVGSLADAEIESLLRTAASHRIGRDERDRIRARAEGNPLFAEELVRQTLSGDATPSRAVPISVADSVLERLARLTAAQRETLEVAAAFGREFRSSLVIATLGRERGDVLATLRAAVAIGLVDETADSDGFRFRHALTRDAIYGELLDIEARELHRRIVLELRGHEQSAETLVALAFHSYAWGDRDSSAHYNELAGDRAAANQAFELAAMHFDRALAVATDDAIARLGTKLAIAHMASGFPTRSGEPARRALAMHRAAGDIEGTANALLLLAEIAGKVGDEEDRLAYLDQAYVELDGCAEPHLVAKRTLCATELALADADPQRVIDYSSHFGIRDDADVSIAIALGNARAHALLMQRRYRSAIGAQTLAVRLAQRTGNLARITTSRIELGDVSALGGDLVRAAKAYRSAAVIASSRWAATERALGTALEAETQLKRGNVQAARALILDAIDDARRSDHHGLIVAAGRTGIFLGMRLDDPKFVEMIVEALDLEMLFRDRTPEQCFPLSGAFAQYLLMRERPSEAGEILRRAVQRLSIKHLRNSDWSMCTLMTIAMAGEESDIERARRPLTQLSAPFGAAFLALFDAACARRRGDRIAAARHAEPTIAAFETYGYAFERIEALALCGRTQEALELAQRVGFVDVARRLREELTPKNRQGRPAGALTSREREIAQLVADGLTNRAIAEKIFVSEKTVETHLASIFTKLEVKSRHEIPNRLDTAALSF